MIEYRGGHLAYVQADLELVVRHVVASKNGNDHYYVSRDEATIFDFNYKACEAG